MLILCIRAAHAQDQAEDRYGFIPLPAPMSANQQAPDSNNRPPYGQSTASVPGMNAPDGSRYSTQMVGRGAAMPPPAPAIDTGYLLRPGDRLRVAVLGEDDLTGDVQIDGTGMVRLPLIGSLPAAGFTAPALENSIAGALAQGYLKNPRVTVEVASYPPFAVVGAVRRPGEYPYVANMNALSAIATGGGFTDEAQDSTVYIRHQGSPVEEAAPASQATLIRPGDVIRVKDAPFWGIF